MQKVYTSAEEFIKQNAELNAGLPFTDDTAVLGASLNLCGKTVPNRLVCQAMEGCDGEAVFHGFTLNILGL